MKIAYCQINSLPAYIGRYGIYCKEAFIDSEGSILGQSREKPIEDICRKIETQYYSLFSNKLEQILIILSGLGIEILVFPEYSIPVQSLYRLYEFSMKEKCICIAASHTVQTSNCSIYDRINMHIDMEKAVSMSCCPAILPEGKTIPIFKKYKSKWESNMKVENEQYMLGQDVAYINYNNQKIAVTICIDALKSSIDPKKTKLIITPAASPSTGEFKNKFTSYLSQDIPSIFCNSFDYGGSTAFCHAPKEENILFAKSTCITEMSKNEEAVVVIDIDITDHSQRRKSTNNRELIKVDAIYPIYYRDNLIQTAIRDNLISAATQKDRDQLISFSDMIQRDSKGIIAELNSYLHDSISSGSMSLERIITNLAYININDFSLFQYQANWIEKTLNIINDSLLSGKIRVSNDLFLIQQRLYAANTYLKDIVKNIADIPVFDDTKKELSTFQNRGSEIGRFRSTYQGSQETIFILNGFPGIGKSALIGRLKYLYSFKTIEKTLPSSAGFEGFLRALEESIGIHLNWDTLSNDEIEMFALELSKALSTKYKTILVIKNVGRMFDEYNAEKSFRLISALAKRLFILNSHIKIIIEINRKLPERLQNMEYVKICKLEPLSNQYIGRLIEQVTTQLTYNIFLPQIPSDVITECRGNPNIAKLIGKYFAEKINKSGNTSLSVLEIESFTNSYVDGILIQLNVSDKERLLLSEMCIYRIAVDISAYELLPSYDKLLLSSLIDKMMVEETSEGYNVNPLIGKRLNAQIGDANLLHKLASEYYDRKYNQCNCLTAKAEYFYHLSFLNSTLKTKDLRFYSNDILSAAEELCENNQYINIAISHLETIQPWKSGYWKYHFILAYCYIIKDNYTEYYQEFERAVQTNVKCPELPYYLMIKKLILARKQNEVENLLNTVQDKFGLNKQLEGLWVSYRYTNKNSREKAISDAIRLAEDKRYDLYCARTIVPILIHEGYTSEALSALYTILNVWPTNDWARSVKHKLSIGGYTNKTEDIEMLDLENEDELM